MKKQRKKFVLLLFSVITVFLSVLFIMLYAKYDNYKNCEVSVSKEYNNKNNEVNLVAVGDVLVHDEQILSAFTQSNNAYEFDNNFKYIQKYIEKADIAYATAEGTFSGKEQGYSGYPLFNTPETMLDALRNTGFDIINGANNHILDKGEKGFFKTLENFEKSGMDFVGVKSNKENKNYLIKEVNNIKIGFTSYTYETSRQNGKRSINALVIPEKVSGLLNTFGFEQLDKDLLEIKNTIDKIKNEGAEFIVVGMHWGTEYSTVPNKYQEKIAKKLNEYGVDLILGSHPHVVQPIETLSNEENNKKTLVVYSMGNFISNQRKETMGNSLTSDGVIVSVKIVKGDNKEVSIKSYEYIPTWVYKYKDDSEKTQYMILPTEEILKDETNELPENVLKAIETSFNSTTNIIE